MHAFEKLMLTGLASRLPREPQASTLGTSSFDRRESDRHSIDQHTIPAENSIALISFRPAPKPKLTLTLHARSFFVGSERYRLLNVLSQQFCFLVNNEMMIIATN